MERELFEGRKKFIAHLAHDLTVRGVHAGSLERLHRIPLGLWPPRRRRGADCHDSGVHSPGSVDYDCLSAIISASI